MYKVLIIEDDFKVAQINQKFVEQIDGFKVIGIKHTGEEAKHFLKQEIPDLILLDVYIPDVDGLELLWYIRSHYKQVDVMMLTAAKETLTIEGALRGGAIDYIVKPVEFARLERTLQQYLSKKELLKNKREMEQEEIDRLWGTPNHEGSQALPKGIDPLTLEKVINVFNTHEHGVTAVELAAQIGTSRTTARRYLEYLIGYNLAVAELRYGKVGRPERRYFKHL